MSFGDGLKLVAQGWPSYFASSAIDSSNPVDQWIKVALPKTLREWAGPSRQYKIVGSSGKVGTITTAPWVATFDRRVTSSAMEGFYVTYLFSVDFRSVYLNIAFGINAFQERVGSGKAAHEALLKAARDYSQYIELTDPRIQRGRIDLRAEPKNTRHFAYEFSSIISIRYDLDSLPSDQQLKADYQKFLAIYDQMISTPRVPEVAEIVDALIGAPSPITSIQAIDFTPRERTRSGSGTEPKVTVNLRRSKLARKIGCRGEEVAIEYEKRRLISAGMGELAAKIEWTASKFEFPGWDISSFNVDGSSRFIEVKASSGDTLNSIEMTDNEWRVASSPRIREQYYLYLVTRVFSGSPKLEILHNPWQHQDVGNLSVEPSVFTVALFKRKTG